MGSSNEELLRTIRYYQENLDRYSEQGSSSKLLSVIGKLKKLPIATAHLEHTGIGRTVNALRKLGGDVGDAAKSLVANWKEMVQAEDTAKEKESANTTGSSENDVNTCEQDEDNYEDTRHSDGESSSHNLSDTEKESSDKYMKDVYRHSNNSRESSHSHRSAHNEGSHKKRSHDSDSSDDDHSSKRRNDSSGFESEDDEIHKRSRSKSKRRHQSESSEEDVKEEKRHKSKKSKHSKESSDSEDNHRSRKSKSKSSRDEGKSSRHETKTRRDESKSKSKEKTDSKRHDRDRSTDHHDEKKSKHSKSRRDSDCEEKSSSKHRQGSKRDHESSSDTEDTKRKSKHEKESSKTKDSKLPHSSKSERKKDSKRDESKEKHSHRKEDSHKREEKHKSKDDHDKRKEKSSSSSSSKSESKSSSSKSSNSEKKARDKEKVVSDKPVKSEKILNGIDSESGASFAEALGMCGPIKKPTKAPSSSKKKPSTVSSPEKQKSSTSTSMYYAEEDVEEEKVPTLLKVQPSEPLNINIASLLPEISPNYRALGFTPDTQPKRILTPDEALSQAISNKNMRTKVYSGNKSHGKVETLFNMCIRVLQENIDALEYTGGVPYSILKPILDKATPDQLFNMEHYNPYLIEDTDELWQRHCQRQFRNKKREEYESWREMYMRCLEEREARLNAITANIKQSQDKSIPVRTTKLAYVDSVVKPPRDVIRKQAKNGIVFDKKPSQTPASRLSALATAGDAGKVAVPNPGTRAAERSSGGSSASAHMKPKKAPLMAKTLSLFKNSFRR